jgi:hypothetical protein
LPNGNPASAKKPPPRSGGFLLPEAKRRRDLTFYRKREDRLFLANFRVFRVVQVSRPLRDFLFKTFHQKLAVSRFDKTATYTSYLIHKQKCLSDP